MSRFFNGLFVGVILGAVGLWFAQKQMQEHPETRQKIENSTSNARESLDLTADKIKDELARTGKVIRRKTENVGDKIADATLDARIVTKIKAAYATDPNLSVWKISVSSEQGDVTLSGSVSTAEDIGRAMALALDVEGVLDVTSTIQVKSS